MARFAFNAYRHQRRLHVWRAGLAAFIILSIEGVTQGDPLAMALYSIALLPLIEHLRREHPRVLQPWYSDDGAIRGTGCDVVACFHELCHVGPQYGYFPGQEKSWAVCAQEDQPELRRIFAVDKLPVKWFFGRRCVGGFAGSKAMERKWVEEKVEEWVSGVRMVAQITKRYPQTAYTGFVVPLQSEWQYICRAFPGVGQLLRPVEDAIIGDFIPALLDIQPGELAPTLHRLLGHGVK